MTYTDEVLADAPVAYWRLDEASGATVAADDTGNGRTLTIAGATPGAASVMPSGTAAYDFDGTNDYLYRPYEAWMAVSSFTFEAWVRFDAVNGYRAIASHDAYNQGWVLYVADGVLQPRLNGSAISGGPTVSVGTTCHVAMTFSGGTIALYVNGVNTNTWTGRTFTPSASAMRVGASHGNNTSDAHVLYFTDGRVDEAAFYGSALSSGRIAAHYTAGTTSAEPTGTLSGTAPAVTGSFSATATVQPIDGTLAGAAPTVTASFAAVTSVPAVNASLAGTAPAVTGSFSGGIPDAVTGSLAGQAPAVFGTFAGFYAAAPPAPVDTDTTYANDGYNYDGVAEVDHEPAIAEPPAGCPRPETVMHVHQSMPAPNLVNGRPT